MQKTTVYYNNIQVHIHILLILYELIDVCIYVTHPITHPIGLVEKGKRETCTSDWVIDKYSQFTIL